MRLESKLFGITSILLAISYFEVNAFYIQNGKNAKTLDILFKSEKKPASRFRQLKTSPDNSEKVEFPEDFSVVVNDKKIVFEKKAHDNSYPIGSSNIYTVGLKNQVIKTSQPKDKDDVRI